MMVGEESQAGPVPAPDLGDVEQQQLNEDIILNREQHIDSFEQLATRIWGPVSPTREPGSYTSSVFLCLPEPMPVNDIFDFLPQASALLRIGLRVTFSVLSIYLVIGGVVYIFLVFPLGIIYFLLTLYFSRLPSLWRVTKAIFHLDRIYLVSSLSSFLF
jgi:hypothetical protein